MPLTETKTETAPAKSPSARIVDFKHAVQSKTGAVGDWTRERADAARGAVERHPLATAGLAAGAALLGGIALGLLLSGQMAGLKKTLERRTAPPTFSSRARSLFRR